MGVNPQSEGLPPLFLIISVTNEIEHKKMLVSIGRIA
jgi:hypothetical protein